MAGASDPEPVRVGDTRSDQHVDPLEDVAPLSPAEVAHDGRRELPAMPRAAARIGQEHRVTRGRKPLTRSAHPEHELVGVPVIGSAVHHGDERERAVRAAAAGRQDEQAVEDEAVGCLVGETFLGPPLDPPQFRPRVADPAERAAGRSGMDIGRLVGAARERGDHLTGTAGGQ